MSILEGDEIKVADDRDCVDSWLCGVVCVSPWQLAFYIRIPTVLSDVEGLLFLGAMHDMGAICPQVDGDATARGHHGIPSVPECQKEFRIRSLCPGVTAGRS